MSVEPAVIGGDSKLPPATSLNSIEFAELFWRKNRSRKACDIAFTSYILVNNADVIVTKQSGFCDRADRTVGRPPTGSGTACHRGTA